MIAITKGNPTPEEIAAVVAVLTIARGTTEPRVISSTVGAWRRSTRIAEFNPGGPGRGDRHWRTWSAGWSCVSPAHAVALRRIQWATSRNVS